jgi:hypothetical protein
MEQVLIDLNAYNPPIKRINRIQPRREKAFVIAIELLEVLRKHQYSFGPGDFLSRFHL